MAREVRLQNLTWEEVRDRIPESRETIVLPVGSTEQHGPHLPVGTDTLVANAIAEAAAAEGGVLVAPPLWFGWSPITWCCRAPSPSGPRCSSRWPTTWWPRSTATASGASCS